MPHTKPTNTVVRQLTFSKTLVDIADRRAAQLGLSTPEYIRHLIATDHQSSSAKTEKLSPQAEKRYLKDLVEFLEQEKISPQVAAHTAEELMEFMGYKV